MLTLARTRDMIRSSWAVKASLRVSAKKVLRAVGAGFRASASSTCWTRSRNFAELA